MKNKRFSLKRRVWSFVHASNGLKILIKEEHNARVHIVAAILVAIIGLLLEIDKTEWFIIIILIGLVISLELINSAIENICDLVSPEYNEFVKKAKDLSAAAVLISAAIAVTIGSLIFIPKILRYIEII